MTELIPWINLTLSIVYMAVSLVYIVTHDGPARWFVAITMGCISYIGVIFLLVIIGAIEMVNLWINLYGYIIILLLSILSAHVMIKR